jgi:hypothetical protein
MSPTLVIVLIVVVLLVIAGVLYAVRASRRKQLQTKFGPEYDRVVGDADSRAARLSPPTPRRVTRSPGKRSRSSSWTLPAKPSPPPTSWSAG